MDEELRQHLQAMEERLMGRITGVQEQMLQRFSGMDSLLTSINTTLGLIVPLLTDIARRVTDLEKKA